MTISQRLREYGYLMRLNKPIGIFLLLWPVLWALWLASAGQPSGQLLFIFISGVIVMRSAGCVINDFADRHFDGAVSRTCQRPLASGRLKSREALILFIILMLLAFLLVLQLNQLAIYYALGGAAIAVLYPFMKRFTHLPQLGLGVAFSWGVLMVFAAQAGKVEHHAWLLFFTALLWPIIYDTFYAMTDREDDVRIGIKSTAILWAGAERRVVGALQVLWIILLLIVGKQFDLNWPYDLSVVIAALLFIYQQWLLAQPAPANYFKAFLNNNWVGAVIFIGIVLGYS